MGVPAPTACDRIDAHTDFVVVVTLSHEQHVWCGLLPIFRALN